MAEPKRRMASLIFLGSMIGTFVSVFFFDIKILTLIFVVSQFCSYIWYVLSYIPFGREICGGCIKKIVGYSSSSEENTATSISTSQV
jgi:hypothetical protein